MAPKHEREQGNRAPADGAIFAPFTKKQKKERTGQEDGNAEGMRAQVGKLRNIPEALEQHFVSVPGNRLEGEEAMLIPRLVQEAGDARIAKIERGVETGKIVSERAKAQEQRNGEEASDRSPIALATLSRSSPTLLVRRSAVDRPRNR